MKKIEFPKNWFEVKVSTWQELMMIDTDNAISKLIQQLSILGDVDSEEIRNIPVNDFTNLREQMKFLDTNIPKKIELIIKIDDKEYGMIPDLNFLTTGEFLDAENWKDKSVENLHLYLALLYRPIIWREGDDYKIEPHKSDGFMRRAELFRKELSVAHIYGTILFFSSLGLSCTKVILDYLESTETQTDKPQTLKKKTKQIQGATKKRKPRSSQKTGSGTI